MSFLVQEGNVVVEGIKMNYTRIGSGEHAVLLLPGAFGTAESHFPHQIENIRNDGITLIAWNPPGFAKSRPPDRTFPNNFLEREASLARKLMIQLNYNKFSLIGWCSGGCVGIILAAKYPKCVRKLILINTGSYVALSDLRYFQSTKDIDSWPHHRKQSLLEIYTEEYVRKTWEAWVNFVTETYENGHGNLCKQYLENVRCPTLIVCGLKDCVIHPEHSVYLNTKIAGSRLEIFEGASHSLQRTCPEEFNTLAVSFLLNEPVDVEQK